MRGGLGVRSPSTPNCAPSPHTHLEAGPHTRARTQTPSHTCCTTQLLLHTYPNSKHWSVSSQLPHRTHPLIPYNSQPKSGPHTHTQPLGSSHNFLKMQNSGRLQPFSHCVSLCTHPPSPPMPAPPCPTPPHTRPGTDRWPSLSPAQRSPPPLHHHTPNWKLTVKPPQRDMPGASQLQLFRKEKIEAMPTSGGERRGGKKMRGRTQTTPPPLTERIKPKIGGVTLQGALDTYTLLLVTFLCLPPPSSRALSLPFPPSWLPSLASLPLSHALSHTASPSPRPGSDPRRPPLRPPAWTEVSGPAGRRALSSADLALPPSPPFSFHTPCRPS